MLRTTYVRSLSGTAAGFEITLKSGDVFFVPVGKYMMSIEHPLG